MLYDRGFLGARHEIQYFRRRAHAAHRRALEVLVAGQEARQHVVQFLQCRGLDAVERCDAQQHVVAHALGQEREDFRRLVALEMDHDGRDDLRVLVADQLRHRARTHPLQAFDAAGVAALQNAVDQRGGFVVAERLLQHVADVIVGGDAHRAAAFRLLAEFADHVFDFLAADRLQARHRRAYLLHFARTEVLEDLGRLVFAERHHQDRAFHDAFSCHCRPPIP